jgi:hypothetical protein
MCGTLEDMQVSGAPSCVEQVLQGSKDVGLGARARSRSSLCVSSSVSLVDLVLLDRYMLLLKNYEYI